jgi:hypothetical protein
MIRSRYQLHRGLFNTACGILFIVAVYRGYLAPRERAALSPAAQIPSGYQVRFCDDNPLHDYSNRNPDHITITLHEGCFGNHTKFPRAWRNSFEQKSQGVGDWAAIWCAGHQFPSEPRPYYEDMGGAFQGCFSGQQFGELYFEGRGTITFRRTEENPEYAALARQDQSQPVGTVGNPAAAEAPVATATAKSYRLTPMEPLGGNPSDYTFTLKQCYRELNAIKCWALITNTTDAPRQTNLHDSKAFDDEGNTIKIGTFVGGIRFSGTGDSYEIQEKLLQGVPTRVEVIIGDPHQNVKTITLELRVHGGEPYRMDTLVFKDVPVQ